MASTYENSLRLELIATGEAASTWGDKTNANLTAIAAAFGYATQDGFAADANATTTVADGAADPARALYFKITSSATLTATRTLTIAPNTISRVMWIENATTGSQSIAISQGSGANVTIPAGKTAVVYLDGAGAGASVVDAMASLNIDGSISAGAATFSGEIAANGGIALGDSDKATFGAGDDLQIYHDGANSYITETGNGNLYITASDSMFFQSADNTHRYAEFVNGGAVKLRFDNSDKFQTTATGIDVTGTVTADGLDVSTLSGDATIYLQNVASARGMKITKNYDDFSAKFFYSNHPSTEAGTLAFKGAQDSTQLLINSNGDVSFYEDTGTTAKMVWDASAENITINHEASSLNGLAIKNATSSGATTGAGLTLHAYDGSSTSQMGGMFVSNSTWSYGTYSPNQLNIVGSGSGGVRVAAAAAPITFHTGNANAGLSAERMRIDTSGNLGIGALPLAYTSLTVKSVSYAPLLVHAQNASINHAVLTVMHAYANTGNTATQIKFQRDNGTVVGTITSTVSATAYNTSSDYRLKEDDVPMTGATERVKALRPINFAWKVDGSRTDGFFAHEAQEVVPEAATGTKDAMRDEEYEVTPAIEEVRDEDGNVTTEAVAAVIGTRSVPDYQGIDQSKLVPLLTAALQEAIAKIETLEARLATLEGA